MTEEKKKVKVYQLKIGNLLLVFKRKLRKDETLIPQTREQLLAADAWQARFFGYKPLGARKFFMSKASIRDYLEKSFSAQPEEAKARAAKIAHRRAKRKERILKTRAV